jgi:hypothetical protein
LRTRFIPTALIGLGSAFAQSADLRSPSQFDPPRAVETLATADKDLAPPGSLAKVTSLNSFLNWGPVKARPHLDYGVTYGNGLQSGPGSQVNTVTETLSPGVLFDLGKRWTLDYTPSLTYYSTKSYKDSLGQSVRFGGGTTWNDWSFGLSQSYSTSSSPLIETAQQTDQESFATSLSASHPFGSKLLLELSASQSFLLAEQFNSTRSWSTMEWLNYQFAPRFSIAGGAGFGFDDVSTGSDMYNEQLQARLNARIAEKLNFSLNGGMEIRQFATGGQDDLINPIYGTSIQYRPFQFTTLTLTGNRRVSPSLLQSQVTESTDISAALSQRLLGLFFLTLSGSYGVTDYLASSTALVANRSDSTSQLMASLAYSFWQRGTASIFYRYSQNSSSLSGFSFNSTQVGLNLGYHF